MLMHIGPNGLDAASSPRQVSPDCGMDGSPRAIGAGEWMRDDLTRSRARAVEEDPAGEEARGEAGGASPRRAARGSLLVRRRATMTSRQAPRDLRQAARPRRP